MTKPSTQFKFIGEPVIPRENSKRPFVRHDKSSSGKEYVSLSVGIKTSPGNIGWVEAFDVVKDKIFVYDNNDERIEIDWEDRLDERVLKDVAYRSKYFINLGEDEKYEFITIYDMIECLEKILPEHKTERIVFQGTVQRDYYNGNYRNRFNLNRVRLPIEEMTAKEYNNKLSITGVLYYNKESLDESDYKETQKMSLDSYILQYINKDEGFKYIPFPVVLSTERFDLSKEIFKKQFEYRMDYLRVKNKVMGCMYWEMRLVNGADEVEWNPDELTPAQKRQIELGVRSPEDFKPRTPIMGNRISEVRLVDPILIDEFGNGDLVPADEDSNNEFYERVYQPPQDETLAQAKAASKAKAKKLAEEKAEDEENPDFDDIF